MTVASAANKVTLNGNGATTSWPFSFRIFDASDLEIYKTDTSGVQTEITSNFSVVVNGESGGTVTYPSSGSPLASGETITIIRVTVRAQSIDFTSQGAFLAQNHEDADDRSMMILQELEEKVDRAFKLPVSDTSGTATELTTDVSGSAGGVLYIQSNELKLSASANIDNLETLAGISGDITTVAANDANITTVATNLTGSNTIGTVASSIANVDAVGGNISNVLSVDANAANINAAVANAANINTVAGISANVTTVAGISADVTTVAGIASDVAAVAADQADIGTVATNIASVDTTATSIADVTTVAADLSGDDDIGTVATNISDVNAVGQNITDITNAVSQAAAGVQRNTYTGDNATVTFALPSTPWADDVVFAYLDGLNQDNSEWSISGSNITFATAPGSGVNIELVVLTAGTVTAAQTSASNAAISAAAAEAAKNVAVAASNSLGFAADITGLGNIAADTDDLQGIYVQTVQSPKGLFAATYDANDVTPYYYDADSRLPEDSVDVVLPSGTASTAAGRFIRSKVLDEDGDAPLAQAKHMSYQYDMATRNRNARQGKEASEVALPALNGFRVSGAVSSPYDIIELYSDYMKFDAAADYDTVGGWAVASPSIFTVPSTAYGELKAEIGIQVGVGTTNVVCEIIELATPGSAASATLTNVGSGSPVAPTTVYQATQTAHGLTAGDLVLLAVASANASEVTALNQRLVEVTSVPDANNFQFVAAALSAAPSSGQQTVTAASSVTITVTSHGYAANDWVYLADITNVTNGWYQVFATPTADTFTIVGINATGLGATPTAAVLNNGAITGADYGPGAVNRTVLAHSQADIATTGVQHVLSVTSGPRKFTAGTQYAVRLVAPSGSQAAVSQGDFGFNQTSYLQYTEYGAIGSAVNTFPEYGRNMAIVQGNIEYMYDGVEEAIEDLSTFSHVILSGGSSLADSATVAALPALYDAAWPVDTGFAGRNGVASTKYQYQRQLVRGLRAKNERVTVWGYVAMSVDAPRGTQASQGDFNTGRSIISLGVPGSQNSTSVGINDITITAEGIVEITTASSLPATNDDWYFIETGDGGGLTDIENAGFRFHNTTGNVYRLYEGDSILSASSQVTSLTVGDDAGTAAIFTETGHGLAASARVWMEGITNLTDGIYVVATVPTSDTFTLQTTGGVVVDDSTLALDGANSKVSPAYIDGSGFGASWSSGGSVQDYWTASTLPNLDFWINTWRKDGVDGIFFDLSGSQWVYPSVMEEAMRLCRKHGLKGMYNATIPSTGAATQFILDSQYVGYGDYIFYEGAGGKQASPGEGTGGAADTISELNSELAVLDANAELGVHAAMLYTESDDATKVRFDVTGISVNGSGLTTITFASAHGFSNSDAIRFNNFKDASGNFLENLNGTDFTVANATSTTLELSGFDGRVLGTFDETQSDAALANVGLVDELTTSGALYIAFKALVDARPEKDCAGAMASGLGLYNRAGPHKESDWYSAGQS